MRTRHAVWVAVTGLSALPSWGCTLSLPDPIVVSQVDGVFPDPGANAAPGLPKSIRAQAVACASHLNQDRSSAKSFNAVRVIVTGLGGVAGGAGGVISAAAPSNQTTQQEGGAIVAAVGGGIALIGTFIVGLIGDPTTYMKDHSNALQSWDKATNLELTTPGTLAVYQALTDCVNGNPPAGAVVPPSPGNPAISEDVKPTPAPPASVAAATPQAPPQVPPIQPGPPAPQPPPVQPGPPAPPPGPPQPPQPDPTTPTEPTTPPPRPRLPGPGRGDPPAPVAPHPGNLRAATRTWATGEKP